MMRFEIRQSSRSATSQLLKSALACLLALSSGACGGGGSGTIGFPGGDGSIQGALQVLDTSSTIGEAEPNDSASQAHILGDLNVGDSVTILGSITDDLGDDSLDAFRINAPVRSRFDVSVAAIDSASAANMTIVVFDSISLQAVEIFDGSSGNSESGSFVASGSFFLGLVLQAGASAYELNVQVSALANPTPEVEPNTLSGDAQFLGNLAQGDSVQVSGALGGSDTSDRFLIALPQAGVLNVTANSFTGADLEVRILDATSDVENPTEIILFESGSNPEIGAVGINPMTLVQVEVFPFSGSGAYELQLSVAAPLTSSAGPSGAGALAPVATLSTKRRGNPIGARARRGSLLRRSAVEKFATRLNVPISVGDVILAGDDDVLDAKMASYGGVSMPCAAGGARCVRFELPSGLSAAEQERYTVALTATLAGDPSVRYAELNQYLQKLSEPNDTYYNLQWHYSMIQLPAAWDITTGSNDVIIAVIDTGSAPATDLLPRTIPGFDMISDAANAGDGGGYDTDSFDVGDSQTSVQNSSFHGAHVAGTIGANTNDGFGVAGVTWAGRIMHVRALGLSGGSTIDIANAIRYAARLANSSGALPAEQADIINMSLGGPGFSQALQDAVTAARNAGTLLIAAAGNDNSNALFTPAALDGVISVAAVDARSVKAPYSNFHPTVDIAAPGGDVTADVNGDGYPDGVLSVRPRDTVSPTQYDVFEFYQGTSMAAPHVAGVAALVKSVNPALSVAQLEDILLGTSTDLGAPGRDNLYGEGLVNAFAAVQAAGGGSGAGPSLNLSALNLVFGNETCRSVQVGNLGGGTLSVTGLTPSTNSGGAWLSAAAVGIASPGLSDTSSIEVCVNRAGLADGSYTGSLVVASNGGSQVIDVTLSVGAASSLPDLEVFVLAVSVDAQETIAQDVVIVPQSSGYQLQGLSAGRYIVVAGTDENNDGFICDEGEPLCGVYPTFENPIEIEVAEDGTVVSIDFPVLEAFLGGASINGAGVASRGYRLLERSNGVSQ